MDISLVAINEDNYSAVLKLKVKESQNKYVANNTYSLAQAYVQRDLAHPMAIMANDVVVGFAMYINAEPKYGNLLDLWRFMIDESHQGKGYGKKALEKIIEIAKDEGKDGVILSFVPGNEKAQGLYRSLGIVETGEIDDGEMIAKLLFDKSK